MHPTSHLRAASWTSAALLAFLCVLTVASGTSQQAFELVAEPKAYASGLVAAAGSLRTIIFVDDLFIAAYATTTVLLASLLADGRRDPLAILIGVGGVATAILDLQENHDLLVMLSWAELSQAIPAERILERSELSQLKWMVGHLAFVLVAVALPRARAVWARVVRLSLFGQLAIGAAAWCVTTSPDVEILIWLRYGSFVAGFVLIPPLMGHVYGDATGRGGRE